MFRGARGATEVSRKDAKVKDQTEFHAKTRRRKGSNGKHLACFAPLRQNFATLRENRFGSFTQRRAKAQRIK
jgi:hypothetical protein